MHFFSWAVNKAHPSRSSMKREISRDLGGVELGRYSIFIEGYDYSFVNYSLFCFIINLQEINDCLISLSKFNLPLIGTFT